mmetsp:Transcript_4957/g.6063  ORF Transcript_4957/g.6063 Transcript_4957/m.6063 type:complete len:222 (+) Transcript_4957:6-671(+)
MNSFIHSIIHSLIEIICLLIYSMNSHLNYILLLAVLHTLLLTLDTVQYSLMSRTHGNSMDQITNSPSIEGIGKHVDIALVDIIEGVHGNAPHGEEHGTNRTKHLGRAYDMVDPAVGEEEAVGMSREEAQPGDDPEDADGVHVDGIVVDGHAPADDDDEGSDGANDEGEDVDAVGEELEDFGGEEERSGRYVVQAGRLGVQVARCGDECDGGEEAGEGEACH